MPMPDEALSVPLELATFSQIVNELHRRWPNLLVAAGKLHDVPAGAWIRDGCPGCGDHKHLLGGPVEWRGSPIVILGTLAMATYEIAKWASDQANHIEVGMDDGRPLMPDPDDEAP